MGRPTRPREAGEEYTREELLEIIKALSSCVLWALKFMKAPGGGLVANLKTGKCQPWEEKFFDALAMTGNEYDRAAYYASREKPKKRAAARGKGGRRG